MRPFNEEWMRDLMFSMFFPAEHTVKRTAELKDLARRGFLPPLFP